MLILSSELNNILQALIVVIMIGMLYTVWHTARAYGGLIGRAVQMMGIGITLVSAVVLEKTLINFDVVENSPNLAMAQDIFTLAALVFLFIGFRRLAKIAKS